MNLKEKHIVKEAVKVILHEIATKGECAVHGLGRFYVTEVSTPTRQRVASVRFRPYLPTKQAGRENGTVHEQRAEVTCATCSEVYPEGTEVCLICDIPL